MEGDETDLAVTFTSSAGDNPIRQSAQPEEEPINQNQLDVLTNQLTNRIQDRALLLCQDIVNDILEGIERVRRR